MVAALFLPTPGIHRSTATGRRGSSLTASPVHHDGVEHHPFREFDRDPDKDEVRAHLPLERRPARDFDDLRKDGADGKTPVVKGLYAISADQNLMSVAENIPVSEETYNQILDLRRPGESLDDTLARLVESVKKQRLTDDIEDVMARDEFVELNL